ncbi:MAG: alginate export family protein [Candidatus Riflebacteria bacterium]|nr:alginate export family protein [Candidatus Riflebacteria bacterium]
MATVKWVVLTASLFLVFQFSTDFLIANPDENTKVFPLKNSSEAKPAEEKLKKENVKEAVKKSDQKKENRKAGKWEISGAECFRYEDWDTFLAKKSTLNHDYSYSGSRTTLNFKYKTDWSAFNATVNWVRFFGLPTNGSAGSGQSYYSQCGQDRDYSKVYFRYFNFVFKGLFGNKNDSATIGRFEYANGAEFKGDNKTIETVKSIRVSDRLFGLNNWTFFQRSMNGILLRKDSDRFQLAGSYWMPTAGSTSMDAGDIIKNIKVLTLSGTFKYNKFIPHQEAQLFFYTYKDNRDTTCSRPDNSGLNVKNGMDINIQNYGFSLIGAYEYSQGVVDTLLWAVVQRGNWFELTQKASAFLAEVGYQWKNVRWTPWFRVGINEGSGDKNPKDGEHGTLFQMLPASRAYAYSTAYNLMNNRDTFLQLILKPHPRTNLRMEYHRLKLVEGADRWYSGSGGTQVCGTSSGITVRTTGGNTDLGSTLDAWISYNFTKQFSLTLLTSRFRGGAVVESSFGSDKNQNLTTLEAIYTF